MMYSSQCGTEVEIPRRNTALVFLTIHEQPLPLPHYCVIRNVERLASVFFSKISSSTRSALDVPRRLTDSSSRTPLRPLPNTIRHFLTRCTFHHYITTQLYPLAVNFLKSAGYVMHPQFNIQQLYALPTLHLCVLYLSENKQRLVPLTA